MPTSAPSSASRRTTALPIPRLPPVTIARLPASSRSMGSEATHVAHVVGTVLGASPRRASATSATGRERGGNFRRPGKAGGDGTDRSLTADLRRSDHREPRARPACAQRGRGRTRRVVRALRRLRPSHGPWCSTLRSRPDVRRDGGRCCRRGGRCARRPGRGGTLPLYSARSSGRAVRDFAPPGRGVPGLRRAPGRPTPRTCDPHLDASNDHPDILVVKSCAHGGHRIRARVDQHPSRSFRPVFESEVLDELFEAAGLGHFTEATDEADAAPAISRCRPSARTGMMTAC